MNRERDGRREKMRGRKMDESDSSYHSLDGDDANLFCSSSSHSPHPSLSSFFPKFTKYNQSDSLLQKTFRFSFLEKFTGQEIEQREREREREREIEKKKLKWKEGTGTKE